MYVICFEIIDLKKIHFVFMYVGTYVKKKSKSDIFGSTVSYIPFTKVLKSILFPSKYAPGISCENLHSGSLFVWDLDEIWVDFSEF